MENIEGGNCGLAVAVGAIGAAAIIGTAILAPYIWASPKTWYTAHHHEYVYGVFIFCHLQKT